jgi:hypothetical protein
MEYLPIRIEMDVPDHASHCEVIKDFRFEGFDCVTDGDGSSGIGYS